MAKNKSGFSIRKLVYNDKYLIIISVVLAIVIWCTTSINLSPETKKTITVPVTVDFSDSAASQLGIKCYGDEVINVEVTINCKKYLAKDIDADDLDVYLQTSTVTSTGNYEVPIKVDSSNNEFTVESFYPTTYRAYFDVEEEKVFDVEVDYGTTDFLADGYVMGDVVLSDKTVSVVGPKSYMNQVDKVVAYANFDGKIKVTQNLDLPIYAVDSTGATVQYVKCMPKNDDVNITIPVLKQDTLEVTNGFSGKPSKVDTSDFNIKYSVNSLNVGVLEEADIKAVNLGNIDFSKLNVGDNEFKFNPNDVESIMVIDDIDEVKVNINVPNSYEATSLAISKDNVEIVNIPDGYKAELVSLNSYSVSAIAKSDVLSQITSEDVNLIIDLSSVTDVKEGSSVYKASTSVTNDYCWIFGDYSATIKIYK